jgi:hypothetical protein
MSMRKQPEGVRRVARGERRVVEGTKQAPDAYDLYLGEIHLGWSERRPKGKWAGFRLADVPGGAGEPFADHTALVEWLLAVNDPETAAQAALATGVENAPSSGHMVVAHPPETQPGREGETPGAPAVPKGEEGDHLAEALQETSAIKVGMAGAQHFTPEQIQQAVDFAREHQPFPGGVAAPGSSAVTVQPAQGDSAPASMADVMKAAEGSATLITDQQVVAAYDEGTASEEVLASADAAAVADDDLTDEASVANPGPTAGQGAITSGAEGVTITEVFETVTGIEVGQDFEAQVAAAVPSLKSVALPHFQGPAEAAAAPWEYPKPDPQPAAPLPPKTSQDFWDSIGDPDADDFPG